MTNTAHKITLRAFAIGTFFAAFFAWLTVFSMHRGAHVEMTSTQIPVLPYILLFATVLVVNPLCRLIRWVRPFSVAEILLVFVMGAVSSGVSSYGLVDQLLPLSGSLFYRDWNTEQAQWDRYIEPFLNEQYFLSYPGIQKSAQEYRVALEERDRLRAALDQANGITTKMLALQAVESRAGVDRQGPREELVRAQKAWDALALAQNLPERAAVLESYPGALAAQEKVVEEKRTALRGLNEKAFQKVETFRRGLPQSLRAYPGILPLLGEDWTSYFKRMRRLVNGKAAAGKLEALRKELEALPATAALGEHPGALDPKPLLQAALDKLTPVDETAALVSAKTLMDSNQEATVKTLSETETELVTLNEKLRWAAPAEADTLTVRLADLTQKRESLVYAKDNLDIRIKSNLAQQQTLLKLAAVVGELGTLLEQVGNKPELSAGVLDARLGSLLQEFPQFDASYRRFFLGDVPWSDWAGPLLRWGVLIALTYLVLMTFNVLIFRQWAHNEKLIYPLVEFPEILVGLKDKTPGWVPEVFRSGLFWLGVAVPVTILGWNLLAYTQVLPGIEPLDLLNSWQPYIQGTALRGLLPHAKSTIFFCMIGLSFLTPSKVSFSLWFFWILNMAQLLLLVWLGHGENENSFPHEWYHTMNFCTAEGGGALLVFAAVVLYKCRRYLLCAFSAGSVRDLEIDEQRELRISSLIFLAGSAGLILMLWGSMGGNLLYTLFFYLVIMVVTTGLVRAVAEGGLLGFQAHAGPFHFIRTLFGFNNGWSSAALFSPLMLYFAVFFLDIKTFIAPQMANGLKVREDLRLQRGRFHLSIWAAILLAVGVALVTSLMMCYAEGANSMDSSFYSWVPRDFFPQLKSLMQNPPASSPEDTGWMVFGAAAMVLLLYFRQSFFWLPHPIGLIMLVNPLMSTYWFSIFLGWIAKSLVTRYGNRETYTKTRALFIGLIVGELLMVMLALCVSNALNLKTPIHLDRNP